MADFAQLRYLTMPTKEELRKAVLSDLAGIVGRLNTALKGAGPKEIETVLNRLGRGGKLPHWYKELQSRGFLPNLDGKTIGSVVEMLFVSILETTTLSKLGVGTLRVNPARGVDLPDLDLSIKSPSTNYCTSEPFFSAYERLLGSEHDAVVLLTDYQDAKNTPPLRLQIKDFKYLSKTQIADRSLCAIALKHRDWLLKEREGWAKRIFCFLAFVNQSDWRAKKLVDMIAVLDNQDAIKAILAGVTADFKNRNAERVRKDRFLIPDTDLTALTEIGKVSPLHVGVIDAAENWVVEIQKDMGRSPNDNEWARLKSGPLDGAIGMSFALQWRYNFGRLFGVDVVTESNGSDC